MSNSPHKRPIRPPSTMSLSSLALASASPGPPTSRPQTPRLSRRPASSMSLRRSPTPSLRRPGTPSQYTGSPVISNSTGSSSMSYTGNIKVSIRVKPNAISQSDVIVGVGTTPSSWIVDPINSLISAKEIGDFTFDNVFDGPGIPNSHIYQNSVEPLVEQVMQGFHGTVFAYGMTGSGKTFSMQGSRNDPGIIPLAAESIFRHIDSQSHQRNFKVTLGYLEIYNERLNDLLAAASDGGAGTGEETIKLRDDMLRGVKAVGLKEIQVASSQELLHYIAQGDSLRRTEGTDFNNRSSRSHAVVQISIDSTNISSRTHFQSTLYLCDLAGSERAVSQTERRKEGAFINKSLLTLGTVIARLSSGGGGSGHVPYRDSKLTRLLQPALSGKSLVSVLCTIQTTAYSYVETLSTLRFAARAKNIVVSAKRNDDTDPSSKTIERLLQQVAAQKLEIEQLRAGGNGLGINFGGINNGNGRGSSSGSGSGSSGLPSPVLPSMTHVSQLEAENRILHERVEHLSRLCDDSRLEEVIGLSMDDSDSDSDNNKYQQQIEEYKSYISHLEKQLYNQEMNRLMSGRETPNEYGSVNGPNSHYNDIIRDLKEEIEELRESNRDKDQIINALRNSNKRKENIAASLSSSANSLAYSRYYSSSNSSLSGPVIKEDIAFESTKENNIPSDKTTTTNAKKLTIGIQ